MSLGELLLNFFQSIAAQLRAAVAVAIPRDDIPLERAGGVDPDFDGWLHGDPSVAKNPASRYGDKTPGYITGNGLGSMEIGAADD